MSYFNSEKTNEKSVQVMYRKITHDIKKEITVELLYNEIVFAAKKNFTIGGFSL